MPKGEREDWDAQEEEYEDLDKQEAILDEGEEDLTELKNALRERFWDGFWDERAEREGSPDREFKEQVEEYWDKLAEAQPELEEHETNILKRMENWKMFENFEEEEIDQVIKDINGGKLIIREREIIYEGEPICKHGEDEKLLEKYRDEGRTDDEVVDGAFKGILSPRARNLIKLGLKIGFLAVAADDAAELVRDIADFTLGRG